MMTSPCITPSQRLARALLHAWSNGDVLALAAAIEEARCDGSDEECDIVDLLKGIGFKMRGWLNPVHYDDVQASLKLLHHLAKSRA